ncbi:MAG: T9SS type A sorting domain-containing protein [Bacteroidales bacterium]|nr:T9SS type A sorting domain-containing protein [Bacteroidales bacterium]MCF8455517.1 T9SS type A sorting domain-containing protein [Bacteroidales bacterium]
MKAKIFTFLLSVFLFSTSPIHAQYIGPGSNWYFGDQAGVSWCTLQANGDPIYLMDGMVDTNEGVATLSDNNCNLLFYTDGIIVWNALHQPMSNSLPTSPGGTLTGDPSSSQSGIIIPKPQDTNTYYIFSVDVEYGSEGLAYSRVDMTANSGLGDIDTTEKNVPLFNPTTEKITAVYHYNGTDIWVITHPGGTNQFVAYLVTNMGVQSLSPVITSIGSWHTGGYGSQRGCMKASPGGGMICVGIELLDIWELLQFNNATGQLSNPVTLDYPSNDDCYGVEFSADEHYLYGSERWGYDIHQWDVSVYNPSTILASHQIVATTSTANGGALQLAPDHKIYLSRSGTYYLGRINQPNLGGAACNYVDQAVLLGPDTNSARNSKEGLPTLIATFFNQADFTFRNSCYNDTVFFYIPDPQGLDSAWWNFNYPSTDTNYHYQGTQSEEYFIYSAGGLYTVELITLHGTVLDTFYTDVYFSQTPVVNLGPDMTLCPGDSLFFDLSFNNQYALDGSCDYFWEATLGTQTLVDSSATYAITQAGVFTVTVLADSVCGFVSDMIHVDYSILNVDLGADTLICPDDTLTLNAQYPGLSYAWSTGETTQTVNISQAGLVWVEVTDTCGTVADSMIISEYDMNLDLGNDTSYCDNDLLVLDAEHPGATYFWSTGESTQTIEALQTGIYALTVSQFCGDLLDEIDVVVNPTPTVDFGMDTIVVYGGGAITLDPNATGTTYQWSDGTNGLTGIASCTNAYSVTVTNEYGCVGEGSVFVLFHEGIVESNIEDQIVVYPNPVQNKLYISVDNLWIEEVRIYNSIGSFISQLENIEGSLEINTQNLSEGIYFVKIRTKDNEVAIKSFSVVR